MPAVMTKSGPRLSSWRHTSNGGRRYRLFVAQLHTTEVIVGMFIIADDMECRCYKDGLPWGQELRPPEDRDGRTP